VNTSLFAAKERRRLDYGINATTRYWVARKGYNSLMVRARMPVFTLQGAPLAGTLLTGLT
jgi:hypothetical protein